MDFGFQSSGADFLDFNSYVLGVMNTLGISTGDPVYSSMIDSLLRTDVTTTHHRHSTSIDEELSPMLENLDVLIWLHLIHPDLAQLVK